MPWTRNQIRVRIRCNKDDEGAQQDWTSSPPYHMIDKWYRFEPMKMTEEHWIDRRRWVNDCPRFRFMKSQGWRAIHNYYEGRRHGLSQALSAKFAMLVHERHWHSGKGIDIEHERWRTNARIDTSKKRFTYLLSNTFKQKITMRDLETWNIEEVLEVPHVVLRNAERFWHVCRDGVQPLGYNHSMMVCDFTYRRIQGWININRGEDLFLLWRYNIPEAVRRFVTTYQILPTPSNLSEKVYGATDYDLKRHNRVIPYVKRWLDWFRQDHNMGRLDEIPADVDLRQRPERALQPRPDDDRYRPEPPSSETYECCQLLKELKVGQYRLRPVQNQIELIEVGKKLHNCAGSYHRSVQSGKCALIVTEDTKKDNKAVALGELVLLDGLPLEWGQIKGTCNRAATPKIRKVHNSYLERVSK